MHGRLWKIREEMRPPVSDVVQEVETSSNDEDFESYE